MFPVVDSPTYEELKKRVIDLEMQINHLKSTERMLRILLDATEESAILGDPKTGVVLACNKRAAERVGKTVHELVGLRIYDYLPPDLAAARMKQGEKVLQSGKPVQFQDNRSGRVYDNHVTPVWDAHGQVEAVAIYARDVTALFQMKGDLKESEERFRTVTEQSPNMIFINARGRVVYANFQCEHSIGYTRDEFYSPDFDFRCLVAPESLSMVESNFRSHAQGRDVVPYECGLITKDGKRLDVVLSTRLIHFAGEHGILGIMADITERKRMEETLRESEKKYLHLYNNAQVGLFRTRLPDGKILVANELFAIIAGYDDVQECIAEYIPAVHHVDPARREQLINTLRAEGHVKRFEAQMKNRHGAHIWVSISARAYFEDGYLEGAVVDITKQKEAEDALLAVRNDLENCVKERTSELSQANVLLKQQFAESDRARKELDEYHYKLRSLASQLSLAEERERRRVAVEVHDHIAQNLALIKMKLNEFRKSPAPGDQDHLEKIASILNDTIQDTRSLVSELGNPVLYELGLVPAVQWLTQKVEKEYGLNVRFEDDGRPKPLGGDIQAFLFQAVRELLINVVKHAGASRCTVHMKVQDGHVQIDVIDDGSGFEAHGIGEMDPKGGSFGFFSLRERLEPLGGRMGIFSKPGEGTRVTVFAPLKR